MSKKNNPADKVEQWPIEKLVPYAKNSRTHSEDQIAQLAASIKEWGFTSAILVDEEAGIIAGHGRVMAARKLGMAQVPVMVAKGWSEAQKRAYVIADNKLALNAGWDNELLALELAELDGLGFDVELTGFSDEEIKALMPVEVTEGLTDPDDAPAVQENPVTVPGDVWVMGKHRLMCGDSTSMDAVDVLMAGGKADMVFTDPPYNLGFSGQDLSCTTKNGVRVGGHVSANAKHEQIANDELDRDDFFNFMSEVLVNIKTLQPKAWYFSFTDLKLDELLNPLRACGFDWKSIIVWMKNQATLSGKDYKSRYEPIVYGCEQGAFYGERYEQEDVWQFQRTLKNDLHPTMKPIPLIEYAIENSSKKGHVVVDLFGGSGSTLIACEKTGRIARLMELDPKYCDVIVKRWQDFTGKQATHAETGKPFAEVKNGDEKAES